MSKRNRVSHPYTYTPGHVITMVEDRELGVYYTRPPEDGAPYPGRIRIAHTANVSRRKLLQGDASASLLAWARLGGRFGYELTGCDPEPPREMPFVWFHVTRDRSAPTPGLLACIEPFPNVLVDNWNQATPAEVLEAVRKHVEYRRYTSFPSWRKLREEELQNLVERSLALPRNRQREVRL